MELLHVSDLWYGPSDVIQPGNFCRKVQGHGPSHNHFYREMLFEATRARVAPESASRIRSVFGLATVPAAMKYLDDIGGGYTYRVQVDASGVRTHVSDLEVFHRLSECRDLEDSRAVLAQFERYWTAPPNAYAEILVEAPATVVGRL